MAQNESYNRASVHRVVHTPGPWEQNGNAVHKRISPHYATCVAVCDGESRHANARLIAAAPSMLAEICNVIDVLDPEMSHNEIVQLRERLISLKSSIEVV